MYAKVLLVTLLLITSGNAYSLELTTQDPYTAMQAKMHGPIPEMDEVVTDHVPSEESQPRVRVDPIDGTTLPHWTAVELSNMFSEAPTA